MIPEVDKNLQAWMELAALFVAILGGPFAVVKALYEIGENRLQRAKELRWKQAEAGKKLSDEMLADEKSINALDMLDWDEREYEIRPGRVATITRQDWRAALRTTDTEFSEKEAFVRDSFDNLLYFMGIMQHYVSQGLILLGDVAYPAEYYIGRMARDRETFLQYMRVYGFSRTWKFLDQFREWTLGAGAPIEPDETFEASNRSEK